ncbi:hypothetical protein [Nocardia sp. NPDC051750]|uniref:hypothetical protein n=1 Tax=Nocardia sp. NPDC051750 TaxID=3364325 RepID=UPI0037AEFEAD
MGSDDQDRERSSVVQLLPVVAPRKLAKVPFVEMADGRLQGVVSSGSDIARVYVSSISAREHGLSCSTNNNRPCGGHSGGYACKHLQSLLAEAVLQYGIHRVARFLGVDVPEDGDILARLHTSGASTEAAVVFSRFLRHLSYLEQPGSAAPVPELHWFPAAGAQV